MSVNPRYVVMVKPADDDHPGAPWIFGVYESRAKADWFAWKVNEKVEKSSSEYTGYAYVRRIHKPRVVVARRLALLGEGAVQPIEQAAEPGEDAKANRERGD